MNNLLDKLVQLGLSETEAQKSIKVVYKWVEEQYPVLAAVARTTVIRECKIELEESKEAC